MPPTASSTPVAAGPFPINPADRPISWTFTGPYAGDATLVSQATADIEKLTGLLGTGKYDDYDLYDGLANDYANLGNGQAAYTNYNRAIAIYPTKGLAYMNLGHLMALMGAPYTAADAYAKAVHVEPSVLAYQTARLMFLTTTLPNDTARIQAALKDASDQFGDTAPVLTIEARWLEGQGRYADAIKAWQAAKKLMPGQDTSAIDAAIARDQAKLK
jgi:tetratricopeptide (TPR) repeat protein